MIDPDLSPHYHTYFSMLASFLICSGQFAVSVKFAKGKPGEFVCGLCDECVTASHAEISKHCTEAHPEHVITSLGKLGR